MKKIYCLLSLIILSITISGCTLKKENKKGNIESEKKEKFFSCKIKVANEQEGLTITENHVYYFKEKEEKLTKYIQKMSFDYHSDNAIKEYAEKNYSSGVATCNEVKDLSGVYCTIENNDDTNFAIELRVVLSEIKGDTEFSTKMKKLENMTYDYLVEDFSNSDNSWVCETYFE